MRRWLGLLAGCALLALGQTGCHHTAGVCDCDPGWCRGYYPGPGTYHPLMSTHQVVPEVHTATVPAPRPVSAGTPTVRMPKETN
jgi:hypothetical protein